jgi:dihydrolipoamide dehydrogenase
MDAEIAGDARKVFEKQGMKFRLGTQVTGARAEKSRCQVDCEGAASLECDRVLLAVGRVPNTADLGLETVGINLDA